jgi:NADPH:quinone reductase-like Zn-dependent oxidoreductase
MLFLLNEQLGAGNGKTASPAILVTAANSAVGFFACQLARARGWRVVAVVRREEAALELRSLLATDGTVLVCADAKALSSAVLAANEGKPVQCLMDAVGGVLREAALTCVMDCGAYIVYGDMSHQPVDLRDATRRQLRGQFFYMTGWRERMGWAEIRRAIESLIAQVEGGTLSCGAPGERVALSLINEAVQAASTPGRSGKVLVVM